MFSSFSTAINADLIEAEFVGNLDTCEVTELDLSDFSGDFEIPDFSGLVGTVTSLSAGDVITVGSSAGSYTELSKSEFQGAIFYQAENELTGPLPTGLIVDIPGDTFPAFANVQVPDVATIALTSPTTGQPVTADTEFTWQAGNDANAYVSLSSSQFSVTDFTSKDVECQVRDDGSFSFPAATKAELGSTFAGSGATISRSVTTFQQQGNAVLIVTRDSSNI